jgi:hypothetical protein
MTTLYQAQQLRDGAWVPIIPWSPQSGRVQDQYNSARYINARHGNEIYRVVEYDTDTCETTVLLLYDPTRWPQQRQQLLTTGNLKWR